MKTASLVIGILALIGLFVGIIPCLGSLNWVNIPFAVLGLILGIVGMNKTAIGQSKGTAITGVVLCAIAIIIGLIRLVLGGGIV
ncbi:MAG: hypothetical protein V4546_01645 [Bacteroidota bacterium]|uniref:DUF4190 domain-containing protein n=1 Tax=Pedobacter cryotolerans TaxID=2571270 RepID=A0A4U1CG67_9SPHI|nr:hypothetical protein [Pedobacter cryotolerans]TKC03361.1 hypothetical protein FA045_01985 [Pedobacter cryotolerans]